MITMWLNMSRVIRTLPLACSRNMTMGMLDEIYSFVTEEIFSQPYSSAQGSGCRITGTKMSHEFTRVVVMWKIDESEVLYMDEVF